jgi:thiamine biosynthesis lipoprotein
MNTRVSDLSFRAMGTDCQILVDAPAPHADRLAELGRTRVDLLERCWSRFQVDSELNQLNASAGRGPQQVSADLLELVVRMDQAWPATDGLFDPTVLNAVNALGYDVDFAQVAARVVADAASIPSSPAPGMAGVIIDVASSTVSLPAGIGIDPGAIGKGLGADIVVDELLAVGATAALVNLGGDISIGGSLDESWLIAIEDPGTTAPSGLVTLPQGMHRAGIATSTTSKRRWASGRRHHIIDPRTGSMTTNDIAQATVVCDAAWRAEVLATTAMLADDIDLARVIEHAGAWCRIVRTDGTVDVLGALPTPEPLAEYPQLEALRG